MIKIIYADDEIELAEIAKDILEGTGEFRVDVYNSGAHLIDHYSTEHDVVLLDLNMPGLSGLDTLKRLKNINPDVKVIMLTASARVEDVVSCMKAGAVNYLNKPFVNNDLVAIIKETLSNRAAGQNVAPKDQVSPFTKSKDPLMAAIFSKIQQFASKEVSVVVGGESGTGKEVIAQLIHQVSGRKGPFVAINCPAIPMSLLESELFGHERGAFTGAENKKEGKILQANNGTLFLDEIGDLSLDVQVKLLRVLQQREVEPLGSKSKTPVNIRVICASNKSLKELVKKGQFRSDLYYRLADIELELPRLKERKADIPHLVDYFCGQFAAENNTAKRQFSGDALTLLVSYPWPGNIRELRSIIRRALIMTNADPVNAINLKEFVPHLQDQVETIDALQDEDKAPLTLADSEAEMILASIQRNQNNLSKVAQELKIGRTTLYRKLKKYKLAS